MKKFKVSDIPKHLWGDVIGLRLYLIRREKLIKYQNQKATK